MGNETVMYYAEIGVLGRGSFRRFCLALGLEYKEEKGFLDSFFAVKGEPEKIDALRSWVKSRNDYGKRGLR